MTLLLPAFTGRPGFNHIYHMDTLALTRALPDNSINCVVTSPPYWMQRKYGVAGEWGSERTLAEYIDNLVILFREIRRVLRPDGVLWLNLGDKYNGGGNGGNASKQVRYDGHNNKRTRRSEFKHKDLMFLPHRVAIALQDDGWYARQDNVWFKPNPLPESVKDRSTRAHEYVFQFTKSPDYWYDPEPVKTPVKPTSIKRRGRVIHADQKHTSGAPGQVTHSIFAPRVNTNRKDSAGSKSRNNFDEKYEPKGSQRNHGAGTPLPGRQTFNERYAGKFDDSRWDAGGARQNGFDESYSDQAEPKANLRSVWKISPVGFKDAHFATFPPRIPEIAILTSCPPYVCPNCGAPWIRQTESSGGTTGKSWVNHEQDAERGRSDAYKGLNLQRNSAGEPYRVIDKGFHQACSCHPGLAPEPGLVYDPFMGSGTTALVALEHGRNYIGAELNLDYVQMANRRIAVARSPGLDDFFKALTVWAGQFDNLPLFQESKVSTES